MPYCQPEHVRLHAETPLTDEEITTLIEESDAEINRRHGTQESTDPLIRKLSALLTAKAILSKNPVAVTVGNYTETQRLDDLTAEINAIQRLYTQPKITATPYAVKEEQTQ
jgi:hypothetical protein